MKEKQLRYENFPESELMCALCGDWTATLLIMRDELPPEDNTSKAVCCECVSCLVTAGLQGAVCRMDDEDRSELVSKQ
jgi:hypothetical protein